MACVSCLLDSFSVFLLSLKQQQNLIKIMFSCIHFPMWPYPPKLMIFLLFYTGKLYGLTGMIITDDVIVIIYTENLVVIHVCVKHTCIIIYYIILFSFF